MFFYLQNYFFMKTLIYIAFVGLFLCQTLSLSAQYEEPKSLHRNFHPARIFSVEVLTTVGIGRSHNTFLCFDNQYALWQRPQQFISLKTGVGMGFMRNDYGKLASLAMPLQLIYAAGKKGHFFEASMGARFIVGFSLSEGIQVVPFITPTLGYRFQIPRQVFFSSYAGLQYHPNLGISPFIGLGVGYDY